MCNQESPRLGEHLLSKESVASLRVDKLICAVLQVLEGLGCPYQVAIYADCIG